jgi:hypothetical protein
MDKSRPAALAAAIALIDRHGGRIEVRGGRPYVKVAPGTPDQEWLRGALAGQRDLLLAVALGRVGVKRRGHTVHHDLVPCAAYGEPSMVAITAERQSGRAPWPRCRMTPGCEGRHQPRED